MTATKEHRLTKTEVNRLGNAAREIRDAARSLNRPKDALQAILDNGMNTFNTQVSAHSAALARVLQEMDTLQSEISITIANENAARQLKPTDRETAKYHDVKPGTARKTLELLGYDARESWGRSARFRLYIGDKPAEYPTDRWSEDHYLRRSGEIGAYHREVWADKVTEAAQIAQKLARHADGETVEWMHM